MSPRNLVTRPTLLVLSFIIIILFRLTTRDMAQSSVSPKTNPDEVIGVWVSEAQDSKLEIYRCGSAYCGKLLAGWGNTFYEKDGKTLKKDTKNPVSELRDRPLFNMEFITNLAYEDGEYKGGDLYVAQLGRTVSCSMKYTSPTLVMRVYVGFPFLGVTKKWTKVT